jgi:hypothetical protein
MTPQENNPLSVSGFFREFWPLLIFGTLFLTMFTLPLVFTGFLTLHGLLIVLAFIVALLLAFIQPWALGVYLLLLATLIFVFQPKAYDVAGSVAVIFPAFVFFVLVTLRAGKRHKKAASRRPASS